MLVTDGVNNAGTDPLGVASSLGAQGISIFTVGIGTNGSGQLIPGTIKMPSSMRTRCRRSRTRATARTRASAMRARCSDRLGTLARTSINEKRRVDLTFPVTLAAGILVLGAALGALALGRFP